MKNPSERYNRRPCSQHGTRSPAPWAYLFGTLLWTWSFFGLAYCTGQDWLQFPAALFSLLGGLGPLIMAAILISCGRWDCTMDRSALQFLLRCFNPSTLAGHWYLRILALIIVLVFAPVLWESVARSQVHLIEVGPLSFILVGLFIGAQEEVGWRGYAQEALQRHMPIVLSSLIIGVFWAAWHLPLFFLPGTYQHGLGVGTLSFWSFHIALLAGSPIYAWLYNAAGRVPFAPMIFHGLGNLAQELVPSVSPTTSVAAQAMVALAVTLISWQWMRSSRPRFQDMSGRLPF